MPYSFTQIEKDKSATIGFVFFTLAVFYAFLLGGLSILLQCYFLSLAKHEIVLTCAILSPMKWAMLVLTGVVAAFIHYFFPTMQLTRKVLAWLRAIEPDTTQEKHRQFLDVIQEVGAATGGKEFKGVLIPDSSLNAFAVDDGQELPVIGITEGALVRLNRAQLEALVAHEAAHILNGDCSRATVVSSMFEVYTMPMQVWLNARNMSMEQGRYDSSQDSKELGDTADIILRLGPVTLVFLVLIAAFYAFTSFCAFLMRMLISREAKLRADATAVRLTRDPLSLAQAIRLMGDNWRGAGTPWESMEGVFFVDPLTNVEAEREGFLAGIFSTHPPIKQRLRILLEMAHASTEQLEKEVAEQAKTANKELEAGVMIKRFEKRWMLQKDGLWYGPFNVMQAALVPWITLTTFCRLDGSSQMKMVGEDDDLKSIALQQMKPLPQTCPVCKVPLTDILYEQQSIKKCNACGGMLVNEDQAGMVMLHKEVAIPPETIAMAKRLSGGQIDRYTDWQKINASQQQNGFICPCCQKTMRTRVFNPLYNVVIDKCPGCGSMWFEKGELELLQALYEARNP